MDERAGSRQATTSTGARRAIVAVGLVIAYALPAVGILWAELMARSVLPQADAATMADMTNIVWVAAALIPAGLVVAIAGMRTAGLGARLAVLVVGSLLGAVLWAAALFSLASATGSPF